MGLWRKTVYLPKAAYEYSYNGACLYNRRIGQAGKRWQRGMHGLSATAHDHIDHALSSLTGSLSPKLSNSCISVSHPRTSKDNITYRTAVDDTRCGD